MGAGGYDMPVAAQLKIGQQTVDPWGTYDIACDGNINRAGSFVYEPNVIFPPGSIKVNARLFSSAEAIAKLGSRLNAIRDRTRVVVAGQKSSVH